MLDTNKLEYQISRNLMTGKALAGAIGISETSMVKIRKGKSQPRPTTLKAMCEALDCKPEDLLKDV